MKLFHYLALLSTLRPAFAQQNPGGLFISPGQITRFETVLTVPGDSPGDVHGGQAKLIYNGIAPQLATGVLQNVVAWVDNSSLTGAPAGWFFYDVYCCSPPVMLSAGSGTRLYEGDLVSTSFLYQPANDVYQNTWFIQRGPAGAQSNAVNINGSNIFDPKSEPQTINGITTDPEYQVASIIIEVDGKNATWDWGYTMWNNTIIESSTNATHWCYEPLFIPQDIDNGNIGYWYRSTIIVANTDGVSSTCCMRALQMGLGTTFPNDLPPL
ncbi:hypothetical protein G7Y89_g13841 [Cudoniella acicularis]|uniref:Uncharacterized protein n=1 Tax=Cudoniella acicularis TaxID=354080 RepID=A0A8H4VXU8_9HELO|nr:hypothetical protein G7Y89_g13841 [Cudoniella acicularis]